MMIINCKILIVFFSLTYLYFCMKNEFYSLFKHSKILRSSLEHLKKFKSLCLSFNRLELKIVLKIKS